MDGWTLMDTAITIFINVSLIALFIYISRKKGFLTFFQQGKWWLTWLAIGIITLMDELTSIYYAPFEAYRFIGLKAIFYIAVTSIFIRFVSTRMVEISEILENNNLKGGGVYSFSYLVFGSTMSFIAIASILVDYILTATISTVSAVDNGTSFIVMSGFLKFVLKFGVVFAITGLNISGIKENAKFTYFIFIFAAFILINLITGGFLQLDAHAYSVLGTGWSDFLSDFTSHGVMGGYEKLIIGIGSCILAYSGIESVLQTASLTMDWHNIKRAYWFLAFTVGIVTPVVAFLALTGNLDIAKHESDLIPALAASIHGETFGVIVSILASVTLIMAVNTAMVASAELIEKFAERYNFHWLMKINKRNSLYRIHLINAAFYCLILIVTNGSQRILAEMYAVGLVASFCINIGALLYYRYSKGKSEHTHYTSRSITLLLFIMLLSTFVYIIIHRQFGTLLWVSITSLVLIGGIAISKTRSPEIGRRLLTDNPMQLIFAMSDIDAEDIHIFFKRPSENAVQNLPDNHLYVSFYSPRSDVPEKFHQNHFRLSFQPRSNLFAMIKLVLEIIRYEKPEDKNITIHFGWPLSSWFDRMSIGVAVFRIMRMPVHYPEFNFNIDYAHKTLGKFKK